MRIPNDGRDADGFAALFTEGAIFEVLPAGGSQPELRLESRAAIHAWVVQHHHHVVKEIHDRHYQSGTLFEVLTPEHAQTRTMVLITHQEVHDPTPRPVLSGVAQFIGLCSRSKWSKNRTKSPFLALLAMVGSNAAYKIISACSNAVR